MFLKKKTRNTMRNSYADMPDGYRETIENGIYMVRRISRKMCFGRGTEEERTAGLYDELRNADCVVIGAGAGLSTSAGLTYSGERFERYFSDFRKKFGISDMYSGGFYPFPDEGTRWAWWARLIYYNRYVDAPRPVYKELLELVKDKEYFVITTNVDHQFQRAGFDKNRLFYTQGDYGLFQSMDHSNRNTYDNEEWVMRALEYQGFIKDAEGVFQLPESGEVAMNLPEELIPKCPDGGSAVTMNLRGDDSFVEDEGWRRASAAYSDYLKSCRNKHVLYLELGVGGNTPVIIKYPFWEMTLTNEKAVYACVNYGEAFCPEEIEKRSILIDSDIGDVLEELIRQH